MELKNNVNYQKALEFIEKNDLNELPVGKNVIDGDNLWVNIVETNLKAKADAKLEAHNVYIDIQIPLSGPEGFGVKARELCTKQVGEFDAVKDIVFFADEVEEIKEVGKGEMIVFAPDMAHAPLIGEGPIKKAIFKVKA